MNGSLKKGANFGITSGIITTLGLIIGLNAGTHSRLVVIGGILTIAVADAFSDSLGMHLSEESVKKESEKNVWRATVSTWLFKFIFASLFIIPFLLFELDTGIIISIVWGLLVISFLSYRIAKSRKIKSYKVILQHLIIAIIVIIATFFIGKFVEIIFG
ncbi:MAG: VIT1/CCC1 transporter family protein [Candidatus Pacearchaeota archaeon]